nr:hypothetical protein [Tanacetum cinerariifolium]
VVYVGNSSTVDDVLDLHMLFETEGVGPVGKFKKMEVDADNESEEESDTEGNDISGSDSEDLDYDPKHDQVFEDDEHILEHVYVSMNNFRFTSDPRRDLSIGVVEVQKDDLDVNDYDSFGSDLEDGIDSQRRIQLRELRRIGKQKNKVPIRGPVIREINISGTHNILGKDKTYQEKGKKVNKQKKVDKYSCPWTMLVAYTNEGRWEVKTLIEDYNYIQSREIKTCTSRFLSDHIIKSLPANPDIPVRAVQDQMQKQFHVRVSKMKAFRTKRITTDKMAGSFRDQYSLLREYA